MALHSQLSITLCCLFPKCTLNQSLFPILLPFFSLQLL
ncbi:rCG53555, partial [Rattus norvegicus]